MTEISAATQARPMPKVGADSYPQLRNTCESYMTPEAMFLCRISYRNCRDYFLFFFSYQFSNFFLCIDSISNPKRTQPHISCP